MKDAGRRVAERMTGVLMLLLMLVPPHVAAVRSQTEVCGASVKPADGRAYEEALSLYRTRRYRQASQTLRRVASRNPKAAGPQFWLGMVAVADGFNTAAIRRYFTRCHELCPDYPHPLAHYYMGVIHYTDGRYEDAIVSLNRYFSLYNASGVAAADTAGTGKAISAAYEEASNYLYWSQFLADAELHKVPFEPRRVEGVSSRYDEAFPFFMPDGRECYYLRRLPVRRGRSVYVRELEESRWTLCRSLMGDTAYNEGKPLPDPFNSGKAEGSMSLTADGNELYYSVITPEGGYANSDLYRVVKRDGRWGQPEKLGPFINGPRTWESQPSVSADGRTLYFASNRKGGQGGIDLWRCRRLANGDWSRPENLGPSVNTPGNEKAPFIAADGHTLYFLSDGWQGFGGYDIYFANLDDPYGNRPTNLGLPVNTESDEPSFGVTLDGRQAYITGRVAASRSADILMFDLYPAARPDPMRLQRVRVGSGSAARDTLLVLPAKGEAVVVLEGEGKLPYIGTSAKLPAAVELGDSVASLAVAFASEGVLAEGSEAVVDALAGWLLDHPRVRITVECPRAADSRAVRERLVHNQLRPDRLSVHSGTGVPHPQIRIQ